MKNCKKSEKWQKWFSLIEVYGQYRNKFLQYEVLKRLKKFKRSRQKIKQQTEEHVRKKDDFSGNEILPLQQK